MSNKTQPTDISPREHIKTQREDKHADAFALLEIIETLTGETAKMWGPSIIGAGQYHYKYDSGREGDMPLIGFAVRKREFVAYILGEIPGQDEILARIGKYKMGKSCLYFKRLSDLDQAVLVELMEKSIAATRAKYPA